MRRHYYIFSQIEQTKLEYKHKKRFTNLEKLVYQLGRSLDLHLQQKEVLSLLRIK